MSDLRQSKKWISYLKTLGWDAEKIGGFYLLYVRILGFSFAKVQRVNISDEELKGILNFCKKIKCIYLVIEPEKDQDIKTLKKFGFSNKQKFFLPTKTLLLDLKKPEYKLFENISRSGKYSIKRAEREEVKINFVTGYEEKVFADLEKVLKESNQRNKIKIYTVEDLKIKAEIFGKEMHVVTAHDQNDILCGAAMFLGCNDKVWYLQGGTTEFGRKTKAGYLMFWKAILELQKLGYRTFDFDGLYDSRFSKETKEWKGFSTFKKKFGGTEIIYPRPYQKILFPF